MPYAGQLAMKLSSGVVSDYVVRRGWIRSMRMNKLWSVFGEHRRAEPMAKRVLLQRSAAASWR